MLCKQIFAPSNPLVLGCSANTPHLNLSWGLWDAAIIMPLSLSCLCTKSFHLAECFIYEMREPYTVGGRFTASVYVKEGGGQFLGRNEKGSLWGNLNETSPSAGLRTVPPVPSEQITHMMEGNVFKCVCVWGRTNSQMISVKLSLPTFAQTSPYPE